MFPQAVLNTSETSEVPIESGTKSDEGKSGIVPPEMPADAETDAWLHYASLPKAS